MKKLILLLVALCSIITATAQPNRTIMRKDTAKMLLPYLRKTSGFDTSKNYTFTGINHFSNDKFTIGKKIQGAEPTILKIGGPGGTNENWTATWQQGYNTTLNFGNYTSYVNFSLNGALSNLFLNGNGNVGIGTFSPSTKLYVNGTGLFTDTLTILSMDIEDNSDRAATTTYVTNKIFNTSQILRPYKVYSALLSQTGINPPTAIELQNQLGTGLVFEYIEKGRYLMTNDEGLFVNDKTFLLITNDVGGKKSYVSYRNTNQIVLETYDNDKLDDYILNNTSVEIRVYN